MIGSEKIVFRPEGPGIASLTQGADIWHRSCSLTATQAARIPAKLVREQKGKVSMRFSGTSRNGDFQEALSDAITAATSGLGGGPDLMVNWHVLLISGVNGGIAGLNNLTVEIFATAS